MRERTEREKLKIRLAALLFLTGALMIVSFLAPYLAPNDAYATNAAAIRLSPCAQYPLGTDNLGRCVLSRVLAGAKTSIFASVTVVAVTLSVGTVLGTLCGYYGGILDMLVMRLADILLAFPQMVLAIAVAGALGGGMLNAMIALGFTGWTLYARLAKSQVMTLKEEEYIMAARLGGLGGLQIIIRHIFPNILGPVFVNGAIQLGTTLVGFAGLSFLGLGVQVPQAEWGSMINEARAYLQLTPWPVLGPGLAVVLTVMLFHCLGDTARDYLALEEDK